MSTCVAIADWVLFFIIHHGLTSTRYIEVTSFIIVPLVGYIMNGIAENQFILMTSFMIIPLLGLIMIWVTPDMDRISYLTAAIIIPGVEFIIYRFTSNRHIGGNLTLFIVLPLVGFIVSGLRANRFMLMTSFVIMPLVGFVLNLALLVLTSRVTVPFVYTLLTNLPEDGYRVSAKKAHSICDTYLIGASAIFLISNFGCILDAYATHYFRFVNNILRPHPRAQG